MLGYGTASCHFVLCSNGADIITVNVYVLLTVAGLLSFEVSRVRCEAPHICVHLDLDYVCTLVRVIGCQHLAYGVGVNGILLNVQLCAALPCVSVFTSQGGLWSEVMRESA